MKIAIDIEPISRDQAGIGHYIQNLVLALARIDQVNSYILYAKEDPRLDLPTNFEIKIVRSGGPWWHLNVLRDAKKQGVDIYHSTHSFQIPALSWGIKTVLTVHDLGSWTHPHWHSRKVILLGKLLPLAIRRSDIILVPTEAIKAEIQVEFAKTEQVFVTPEGVGEAYRPGLKKVPGQIAFVGTLEPRKNLIRLVEAVSELKDLPVSLKIAGKKGWHYDQIFETVKKLNLADRVEFLGYISEPEKVSLLQRSQVFAFPSLYEGFGLPVLEAMACGTAVVTSNMGALSEVVGDGALTVNPTQSQDIAAALRKILTEPQLAESLKKKGLARARDFTWRRTAELTLQAYETC